jgi:glycine betaine/proline transport system ATP-binding protein
MEGGRIIQSGVAEDIVLRPATDYVAEFVRHMNPLSVLTGATVMRAYDPVTDGAPSEGDVVSADTSLADLIDRLHRSGRSVYLSAYGEVVGICGPGEILAALARR